jgi:hypothetical protein
MSLQDALRRILSPHPGPTDAGPFITVALRIATLHLRNKTASGAINPAFFGLTIEDLAVDCIGQLFERDGLGRFVQLQEYYLPLAWEALDETELLAHTRRLAFSKVNQQLARLYKESDPSLEKLMRNLRNAIRAGTHLVEERRAGELWVTLPDDVQPQEPGPLMPWEFLEGELVQTIQAKTTLKDIVRYVAELLAGQNTYRRSYPFTTLALIIRTVFVRAGEPVADGTSAESHGFTADEVQAAITRATSAISVSKNRTYVAGGKIGPDTYAAYMQATRTILQAEFVENDGDEKSYYDQLAVLVPDLSMADYRENHRCHFEYLVKLSREEFLRLMKIEL